MDPRHPLTGSPLCGSYLAGERGMSVNLPRTGKGAKLSNVTPMAESRENVSNAVAGDIIRVYDTGTYQVGNTLTVGKNKFEFEPLPNLYA